MTVLAGVWVSGKKKKKNKNPTQDHLKKVAQNFLLFWNLWPVDLPSANSLTLHLEIFF